MDSELALALNIVPLDLYLGSHVHLVARWLKLRKDYITTKIKPNEAAGIDNTGPTLASDGHSESTIPKRDKDLPSIILSSSNKMYYGQLLEVPEMRTQVDIPLEWVDIKPQKHELTASRIDDELGLSGGMVDESKETVHRHLLFAFGKITELEICRWYGREYLETKLSVSNLQVPYCVEYKKEAGQVEQSNQDNKKPGIKHVFDMVVKVATLKDPLLQARLSPVSEFVVEVKTVAGAFLYGPAILAECLFSQDETIRILKSEGVLSMQGDLCLAHPWPYQVFEYLRSNKEVAQRYAHLVIVTPYGVAIMELRLPPKLEGKVSSLEKKVIAKLGSQIRVKSAELHQYSQELDLDGEKADGLEFKFNEAFRVDDSLVSMLMEKQRIANEMRHNLSE